MSSRKRTLYSDNHNLCPSSWANLDIKFWPYAFYHAICISNALLECGATQSPISLATEKPENFANNQTFGCCVWVQPPGSCSAKLKPNFCKGIFLGYVPCTTWNILWYNLETSRIKIATHFFLWRNEWPANNQNAAKCSSLSLYWWWTAHPARYHRTQYLTLWFWRCTFHSPLQWLTQALSIAIRSNLWPPFQRWPHPPSILCLKH